MPLIEGHLTVFDSTRRATYAAQGIVKGQLVHDNKRQVVSISINDSGEVQIGPGGSMLQWTAMSRFTVELVPAEKGEGVERRAVLTDTFLGAAFTMTILWDKLADEGLLGRLVLSPPLEEPGGHGEKSRILGVLQLGPPSGQKEALRAAHVASPPIARGPGL